MHDIKIIIDTGADMPPELVKKYNFGVLSFMSIFGEKSYKTGVDITNSEFYDMLDAAENIPTTSQTPPAEMFEVFARETKEHEAVIYFTLSSKGSGQNHTAHLMAEDVLEENPDAKLYIVDTMSYSVFIAQTAIKAAELVKEGKTAEEIIEYCNEYIKTWHCFLLVNDLKYLEKGGRINKAEAILGGLLDIKPIITVRDGLVEPDDKLRGKKRLVEKVIQKIQESPDFDADKKEFLVVHSDKERGDEVVQRIKEVFGIDDVVLFTEFGPIIGTHVGRGAFAIIFRKKDAK